jgi:hypothetical protein
VASGELWAFGLGGHGKAEVSLTQPSGLHELPGCGVGASALAAAHRGRNLCATQSLTMPWCRLCARSEPSRDGSDWRPGRRTERPVPIAEASPRGQ